MMFGGDKTYPESWDNLLALFGIESDEEDFDDEEKPIRKPGEIIYCKVSFNDDVKSYYYQTEDESVEIGDRVFVTVGLDNHERIYVVKEIDYFEPNKVPLSLGKTKHINSKCND
jgi:hypothetical protein